MHHMLAEGKGQGMIAISRHARRLGALSEVTQILQPLLLHKTVLIIGRIVIVSEQYNLEGGELRKLLPCV